MNLQQKIASNTWDNIDDFIAVLKAARAEKWYWFRNTRCKYVELRVDMRDGGCIIKDREGVRIAPEDLSYQEGQDAPVDLTSESDEITRLSAELAAKTAECERLNDALKYEQHRTGRVGTHGPGCWSWGPAHYECALREIETLDEVRSVERGQ